MFNSTKRFAPPDSTVSELIGKLANLRQVWPNPDGSVAIVADLMGGECVRGTVEVEGDLVPGGLYRFLGRWAEHERFGWQFAFDLVTVETPDDPDGIAAYLARHADRVGAATAGRLVAAYGREAISVLIDDYPRVVTDEIMCDADAGLASMSLRRIYADPALREAHQELFTLFRTHGFWGKTLKAALRRWRASAPAQIRRDPFLMLTAGLPGCGFLRVDRLYMALKKNPRRLKRQAIAAWYALEQLDGDTWTSATDALRAVRVQIGGTEPREQRAVAMLCRAGLAETITDEAGKVWIAEREKAVSERACAHMIRVLSQAEPRWPSADSLGLNPETDSHQIEQLRGALTAPVVLLTGSPGTGKTHCAAQVIRGVIKMVGASKVAVCAPTGKAAVRITEKLSEAKIPLKATTIHKLLGVKMVESSNSGVGFEHDSENRLPFSHVIVDETSMEDISLAACHLRAMTPGTNILFVGDPHQLPPVGHGAFLRDLIDAKIPRAHLTEIRRNAGLIVRACHQIKDGHTPKLPRSLADWPNQNLIQLPWGGERSERDRAIRERLDSVYEWLKKQCQERQWDLIDDVQVIVARNATREALNTHLQARLNPDGEKGPGGYRIGDKVICLKNGFALPAEARAQQIYCANGDFGRVMGFRGNSMIVELSNPARRVLVPLGKGVAGKNQVSTVESGATDTTPGASWALAYACTCHKYQGSEVQVAIVLVESAGKLGSREWIYTGISRARSLCLLLGDDQDVKRYVNNVTLPDRKTFLRQLVTEEVS